HRRCPCLHSSSLISLRTHRLSYLFRLSALPPPRRSPLFPYTTLFRSTDVGSCFEGWGWHALREGRPDEALLLFRQGRPSRSACRSEEHTSELQSPDHLVCRLLLEKKKKKQPIANHRAHPIRTCRSWTT